MEVVKLFCHFAYHWQGRESLSAWTTPVPCRLQVWQFILGTCARNHLGRCQEAWVLRLGRTFPHTAWLSTEVAKVPGGGTATNLSGGIQGHPQLPLPDPPGPKPNPFTQSHPPTPTPAATSSS